MKMIIGIDAKTISIKEKTGVENYLTQLLFNLAKIDKKNEYWLYAPKNFTFPAKNFKIKKINFPFAWTQLGLSLEFLRSKLKPNIFFAPAHSLPIFCPMKSVVTIHDLAFLKFPRHFTCKDYIRLKMITKRAVKKATKIIAVSETTKNDIIKYYHIPAEKIRVVYSAYDKKLFRPANQAKISKAINKFKIKKPYLIYIGTLQRRKNINRLISAFDLLKRKYQIPHQLVIVGKKGWLYDEIFQKTKESVFSKSIIFTGFVKSHDLPALLSGAEVFILPSLYEGFGLPVLEAMACGVPVVASNSSSLSEIVGENGILVNPYKVSDIAEGMYKIISSPKLKEKYSQMGLKRVKDFSWKKCAKETLKIFEELR